MPPPGHRYEAEYRQASKAGFAKVRVRFDTRGLAIEEQSRDQPSYWPYATLGSDAPVPCEGSHRVVLRSTAETNATLSLDDAAFWPSLLQAAPQLGRKQARGPAWIPLVLASLGTIGLVAGLLWAIYALFPYKAVARRIPDDTREQIGKVALAEISKGHKRCEAAPGAAALNKLVDRLGQASGSGIKFKVQVVDWNLVNAFAVMGNQIVLTRGLLKTATSPDEVAGVLGHEMGHAIEVHPEEAVLRALGTVIAAQLLLGGWTPDLVTQAGSQLLLLRHSRANETEADEVALRLLKAAKVAPGPFANFFEKISKDEEKAKAKEKGYRLPDVFATHPPPPERAARARSQADYPATPALDAADWDALRKICG